jgi:hypothetical protein
VYDENADDIRQTISFAPRRTLKQVMGDRVEKKSKKNGTWVEPSPSLPADIEADSAEAKETKEEEDIPYMNLGLDITLLVVTIGVCVNPTPSPRS